jgi:hypothetical protein
MEHKKNKRPVFEQNEPNSSRGGEHQDDFEWGGDHEKKRRSSEMSPQTPASSYSSLVEPSDIGNLSAPAAMSPSTPEEQFLLKRYATACQAETVRNAALRSLGARLEHMSDNMLLRTIKELSEIGNLSAPAAVSPSTPHHRRAEEQFLLKQYTTACQAETVRNAALRILRARLEHMSDNMLLRTIKELSVGNLSAPAAVSPSTPHRRTAGRNARHPVAQGEAGRRDGCHRGRALGQRQRRAASLSGERSPSCRNFASSRFFDERIKDRT